MRMILLSLSLSFLFCVGIGCPPQSDFINGECVCRYGPDYDHETLSCPNPLCPIEAIGTYPNCTCIKENDQYSVYVNECYNVCPIDSVGIWPNCECNDPKLVFDKLAFECRECPRNSESNSVYPNCDCDKIGIFDRDENKCITCPLASNGIYPNCICEQKNAVFFQHKPLDIIECRLCVNGSNGFYPDCVCDGNARYDSISNVCNECGEDQVIWENFCGSCREGGIYPNCTCMDNGLYDEKSGNCQHCSDEKYLGVEQLAKGNYPDCTCPNNGFYDGETCRYCMDISEGIYPNCICQNGGKFDPKEDECIYCPENASGDFGKCICPKGLTYNSHLNTCDDFVCPQTGIYPNCECRDGVFNEWTYKCLECPANTTGSFPKCICPEKGQLYSAFLNQCYFDCPTEHALSFNSFHPYCLCEGPYEYDLNERVCKFPTCPETAIGEAPYCRCIAKNNYFIEIGWICYHENNTGYEIAHGPSNQQCPDMKDTYPQCFDSAFPNHILSLVG